RTAVPPVHDGKPPISQYNPFVIRRPDAGTVRTTAPLQVIQTRYDCRIDGRRLPIKRKNTSNSTHGIILLFRIGSSGPHEKRHEQPSASYASKADPKVPKPMAKIGNVAGEAPRQKSCPRRPSRRQY